MFATLSKTEFRNKAAITPSVTATGTAIIAVTPASTDPSVNDIDVSRADRAVHETAATPLYDGTPPDPDDLISHSPEELLHMRKLVNDHMTDKERALKSFSHKNLMKLSNWKEWNAADRKQLDN